MRSGALALLVIIAGACGAAARDLDKVREALENEGERLGKEFGASYRSEYSKQRNVMEFWEKAGTRIGEQYGEAFGRTPDMAKIGGEVGRAVGAEVGKDLASHILNHLKTELKEKERDEVQRFMKEYGTEAGKEFGAKVHGNMKQANPDTHWKHAWVPYYWQGIGGGFGEILAHKMEGKIARATKWADIQDEALEVARHMRDDGQKTVDFVATFGRIFDKKFLGL